MRNIIVKMLAFFKGREVVRALYENGVMSVTYNDGTVTRYVGECTVWHEEPMMRRCSLSKEELLCDLYKYNKRWSGAYPDAHKKFEKHD